MLTARPLLLSPQDILFVQSAILEAHDVYQPVNLGKQLLQSSMLDVSGRGARCGRHTLLGVNGASGAVVGKSCCRAVYWA